MFCTLTMNGVPLGQVELVGAPRAVGLLGPLEGYATTGFRGHARRLGQALSLIRSTHVHPRVVARALAAALMQFRELQDRLALLDIRGGHIAIVHIIVAEFPGDPVPRVVAELREHAAPVPAALLKATRGQPDAARPAA